MKIRLFFGGNSAAKTVGGAVIISTKWGALFGCGFGVAHTPGCQKSWHPGDSIRDLFGMVSSLDPFKG